LLRVYESAGKNATVTVTIPPGSGAATRTNLMEQPEGSPISVSGDKLSFPIHPWEIQTIRVDYAHPAQVTSAAK
jgi:alpha-mannosidase